jgi:hypothetical protein
LGDLGARKAFRGRKFHVGGKIERHCVPLFDKMVVNPLSDIGVMIDVTGNVPFPNIERVAAEIYAVDAFHSGQRVPD